MVRGDWGEIRTDRWAKSLKMSIAQMIQRNNVRNNREQDGVYNNKDIPTPSEHTSTVIKEEPAGQPDLVEPYVSPDHVKEEPASHVEGTQPDYVFIHVKEERSSRVEEESSDAKNHPAAEYEQTGDKVPRSEESSCGDGDDHTPGDPESEYISVIIKEEPDSDKEEGPPDRTQPTVTCDDSVNPGQSISRIQKMPSECRGSSRTIHKGERSHKRTHGYKVYGCTVCQKCFASNADLVKHRRIHTGEKPFSCSECGKSFSDKSNLLKHRKFHARDGPFACGQCGKPFSYKSDLVTHQRVHTGDKPFSCSECGKSFYQNSHVVEHQKIHRGEKAFSCSECGKRFTRSSHLAQHQMIHTGEKPFSCPECGKPFNDKSNLLKHQRLHARCQISGSERGNPPSTMEEEALSRSKF